MSAHGDYRGPGYAGEFESEVALPVRVRFAVDAEGRVELTHVALSGHAAMVEKAAALVWPQLALRERRALEQEARAEAQRLREE